MVEVVAVAVPSAVPPATVAPDEREDVYPCHAGVPTHRVVGGGGGVQQVLGRGLDLLANLVHHGVRNDAACAALVARNRRTKLRPPLVHGTGPTAHPWDRAGGHCRFGFAVGHPTDGVVVLIQAVAGPRPVPRLSGNQKGFDPPITKKKMTGR